MSKALSTIGKIAGVIATVAAGVAVFSNPATAAAAMTVAAVASAVATAPSPGAPLNIGRKPMTAINAYVDNAYAYVATDGAAYNVESGKVVDFTQKAAIFNDQRLVLAITGRSGIVELLHAIDRVHPQAGVVTQASILAALPEAVRSEREALRMRSPAAEIAGRNALAVTAAYFDGEPRLARCWSINMPGEADERAYQLHPIDGFAMPALTAAQQRIVWPKGYVERPVSELRQVLAMQRHARCPEVVGGCLVGGPCYFYRVGRHGVDSAEIMRFPEKVGEPLDPARAGKPVRSALDGLLAA